VARTFTAASSHVVTASIGGLSALTSGTIVAVVKRASNGAYHSIVQLVNTGGTPIFGMEINDTNGLNANTSANDIPAPTLKVTAADGWVLLAITKAAGTSIPRFHKYVFSTATWTRENMGGSSVQGTAAGAGTVQLGKYSTSLPDYFNGDMSAVAVWSSVLTDDQLDEMVTTLDSWTALSPQAMWVFNQASTATALSDITGGGANQTAITGTAVAAGDPIAFAPATNSPPTFRAGAQAFGTASSAVLTIPGTVQTGDRMVIVASFKQLIGGGTVNTPTGWTQVAAPVNGPSGNSLQGAIFAKTAVSGDAGSTVTVNASAGSQQMSVAMAAYSGATGTFRATSWVVGSTTAATALTVPAPATAPSANDLVLLVGAVRQTVNGPANTPTLTAPSGATIRAQIAGTSGSAQNVAAFIGDHNDTSGARTVTASTVAVAITGQLILQPSAAAATVHQGAADLSASSSLSASGAGVGLGAASLGAASSLTAAGTRQLPAVAALGATSGLTASAVRATAAAADLSVSSGLGGTAIAAGSAAALLSAGTALSSTALRTVPGQAALSASSGLGGTGVPVGPAGATLSATTSLAATSVRTTSGQAVLAAATSLSATSLRATSATAPLSAVSSLSAQAGRIAAGAAGLSAATSLSATSLRTTFGVATLTTSTDLSAASGGLASAAVSLTATSGLVAGGLPVAVAGATLVAATTLGATIRRSQAGAAGLSARADMFSVSDGGVSGTAELTASTALTVIVRRVQPGGAALATVSGLNAAGGSWQVDAAAVLAAGSDLAAGTSGGQSGVAILRTQTTLLAAVWRLAAGQASLSASTALAAGSQRVYVGAAVLSAGAVLAGGATADGLPAYAAVHGITIRRTPGTVVIRRPSGGVTRTDPYLSTVRRST
jgi:hypothetical protein